MAGVAALIVGAGVTDPDAVEKVLKDTARQPERQAGRHHYGAGIVDARAALSRVNVTFGWWQLGLALLGAAALASRLVSRKTLAFAMGPKFLGALVVGSSGLFFLRYLGLGHLPGAGLYTHGFPAWDLALFGVHGHANPLFYSALVPVGLIALLFGVQKLRPYLAGFALGVAGHLLFQMAWGLSGIRWLPSMLAFDQMWLAVNAVVCMGAAYLVARR